MAISRRASIAAPGAEQGEDYGRVLRSFKFLVIMASRHRDLGVLANYGEFNDVDSSKDSD